ncbi:hypothetical protein JTB14_029596 [Gonioctena quinquepunctata]|nr:hypothetical protein JTB14_029596 [Gonioctena quinquepunctata]
MTDELLIGYDIHTVKVCLVLNFFHPLEVMTLGYISSQNYKKIIAFFESDSGHSTSVGPYYNIVSKLITQVDNLKNRLSSIESSESFGYRKYNSTDDICLPSSTQSTPQKPLAKFKLNSLPASPNIDRFSPGKKFGTNREAWATKTGSPAREDERMLVSTEEPVSARKTTWQSGDDIHSVPDLGKGVREAIHKGCDREKGQRYPQHISSLNSTNNSLSSFDKYPLSDSSTDSTQLTRYERQKRSRTDLTSSPLHSNALSILNMHKQLLEDSAQKRNDRGRAREHKQRSHNTIANSLGRNLGLLSLADIWSNNSQIQLDESQLSQKLQEEKLRRQHCEDLIQELQNRNLELQEKLSVAITVDKSKNKAIHQFQDALEKILIKFEKLDKEKREHDNEVSKLKKKHAIEMEDATQKLVVMRKKSRESFSWAMEMKKKWENFEKEMKKNKQLAEMLSQKEIEIIENKNTLNDARCEVARSKRAVEVCQSDFSAMKNEYSQLQSSLKSEKDQNAILNEQTKAFLVQLDGHKNREKDLNAELSKVKSEMESNKVELRNFYQGQVEILVQNKLKEFQSQLDQAQANFKEDVKKREMSIAKTAAIHIQQISEKYSLEIKLLEKKHQEEVKLYQIQIMQHKQQTENLQSKLDQLQDKRLLIAKQMKKIMESQWTEAFRIIASGKSPTVKEESTFTTIDQLNSLRTRSYNNIEEILAQQQEEQMFKRREKREENCSAANEGEKVLQAVFESRDETPVSSRVKSNKFSEGDIQKYIQLLLNRQPGNPVQEESAEEQEHVTCDNNEQSAWSQGNVFSGKPRHK